MAAELLRGDVSVDDRGHVAFVNDFTFQEVKRFYVVGNHDRGYVRAWHGHRREHKYAIAIVGAALVCCVEIDDWDRPARELDVQRFVLDERKPAVLSIPAGHVNGFKTLTPGTRLMFFSTATLDESLEDDIRFPARYWDPWSVEER
jgi:dTDP-4-dehydrorhamnose 3,5-epimerase